MAVYVVMRRQARQLLGRGERGTVRSMIQAERAGVPLLGLGSLAARQISPAFDTAPGDYAVLAGRTEGGAKV